MSATFDLGLQTHVILVTPEGANLDLGIVTEFQFKEETSEVTVAPLNSPPEHEYVPQGYSGSFTVTRRGPDVEEFFASRAMKFWNGARMGYCKIYQFTRERDGTESAFQFTNVAVTLTEGGSYKATEAVSMNISFKASDRIPVGF